MVCDEDGRKTAKKFPVWMNFYDMGADSFSVSKNIKNKPDLRQIGEGSNLLRQKEKDRVVHGEDR